MKKITILMLAAILIIALESCTKYNDVKLGIDGTVVIQKLPAGQHIVNATWKDQQLWVLSRNRKPTETIDTLNFDCYEGYDGKDTYSSRLTLVEQ